MSTFFKTVILFSLIFLMDCNKDNNVPPVVLQDQSSQQVSEATIPKINRIVVVIEENHAYGQIIGSSNAPYINSLARDEYGVVFTQSFGITYGSQPNYFDLFSGSNQGINSGRHPPNEPFTTPNLARQLINAGKSFSTYAQGLPYVGYNGDSIGYYVRWHNPSTNWMGTSTNQIPKSTDKPFTYFPSDFTKLPTVSFVIPNLKRDMHNGTVKEGDDWLKNNLNNYIQWAKTHNSLFILTFDEDDGNHHNHIPTLFYGPMIRHGKNSVHINHYNVLRTIEDIYGLPYAGNAAYVNPISNCWK